MITRFYADVLANGDISRIAKVEDPDDGPPELPHCVGRPEYLGTSFTWDAPSDTCKPVWVDGAVAWVETLVLAGAIDKALLVIDAAADEARSAALLKNTTKAEEYSQAEAQAKEWAASDYLGEAPPDVASWAAAKWRDEMTEREAADDILATAERYRTMLSGIRALRLKHMEDARHAANDADVQAVIQAFKTELSNLMKGLA